jgi:hypothetical protein
MSEKKRNADRISKGKSEGKGPLERPRHKWEDLIEMGWGDMGWINLGRGTSGGLL